MRMGDHEPTRDKGHGVKGRRLKMAYGDLI